MANYIIIIIISLFMSAFFSAMEIAYFSANRLRLELERKQSKVYNYVAGLFLGAPGQFISAILVGNNVALVVYSTFMSQLIQIMIGGESYLIETVVSTVVIIFTAEFLPKAIVKANPNFYMRNLAVPIYLFYLLFYPLAKFATILSALLLRLIGLRNTGAPQIVGFDKIDLAALVENSSTDNRNDMPNENEIKIFQNALDFSDLQVRDCMLPRIDIQAFDIEGSLTDLHRLFCKTHFSRLPVYEGSIDNIVGYVSSRTLFEQPENIRQIVRQIVYVPESGGVQKLLGQLIKSHRSMAIVIDEFGGTAGLITIEDILEEIFGEIEDEHDEDYLVEKKISDKEYVFSGRLEVEYLNKEYGLDIPESDHYETLAGLILFTSENLPQVGEVIQIGHLTLKILRASSSKIAMVELSVGNQYKFNGN